MDGNRPNPEAVSTTRVEPAAPGGVGCRGRRPDAAGDRVQLLYDAQLLTAATAAVWAAPTVRQEKVEQARKALAAGELGADAGLLADKMIDTLLGR